METNLPTRASIAEMIAAIRQKIKEVQEERQERFSWSIPDEEILDDQGSDKLLSLAEIRQKMIWAAHNSDPQYWEKVDSLEESAKKFHQEMDERGTRSKTNDVHLERVQTIQRWDIEGETEWILAARRTTTVVTFSTTEHQVYKINNPAATISQGDTRMDVDGTNSILKRTIPTIAVPKEIQKVEPIPDEVKEVQKVDPMPPSKAPSVPNALANIQKEVSVPRVPEEVPKPAQTEVQQVDSKSFPTVPDEVEQEVQKDRPTQTVAGTTGDGPIPKGTTPAVVVPTLKRPSQIDRTPTVVVIPKTKFPTVEVPAPRAQSYASRASSPSAHHEARQPKHEPTRARARTPSAPPRRPAREPAYLQTPLERLQACSLRKAARERVRTLVLTDAESRRINESSWTQVKQRGGTLVQPLQESTHVPTSNRFGSLFSKGKKAAYLQQQARNEVALNVSTPSRSTTTTASLKQRQAQLAQARVRLASEDWQKAARTLRQEEEALNTATQNARDMARQQPTGINTMDMAAMLTVFIAGQEIKRNEPAKKRSESNRLLRGAESQRAAYLLSKYEALKN